MVDPNRATGAPRRALDVNNQPEQQPPTDNGNGVDNNYGEPPQQIRRLTGPDGRPLEMAAMRQPTAADATVQGGINPINQEQPSQEQLLTAGPNLMLMDQEELDTLEHAAANKEEDNISTSISYELLRAEPTLIDHLVNKHTPHSSEN